MEIDQESWETTAYPREPKQMPPLGDINFWINLSVSLQCAIENKAVGESFSNRSMWFFALGWRFQKWLFSKDELQEIETGLNFFVPSPHRHWTIERPSNPWGFIVQFSLWVRSGVLIEFNSKLLYWINVITYLHSLQHSPLGSEVAFWEERVIQEELLWTDRHTDILRNLARYIFFIKNKTYAIKKYDIFTSVIYSQC